MSRNWNLVLLTDGGEVGLAASGLVPYQVVRCLRGADVEVVDGYLRRLCPDEVKGFVIYRTCWDLADGRRWNEEVLGERRWR